MAAGAAMSLCPTCSGAKELQGIACGGPSAGPFRMACYDCGGTGEVADIRAIWAREGDQLRATRAARDLSLREAARWVGVTAAEWSAAEFGRIDPKPIRARVAEKALEALGVHR